MDVKSVLVVLMAVFALGGGVLAVWLAWSLWQMRLGGAPYWPTSRKDVQRMIDLARITPQDQVVELGSGDGRLVFAAAEAGASRVVGYEIDPILHGMCASKAEDHPLTQKIEFRKESFWDADLSPYSVIIMYQTKHTMHFLKEKMAQLPNGARIICNRMKLPGWTPDETSGKIYRYIVKK